MGKGRLEAFSDGVLAIIITIMVLEMRPPEGASLDALRPLLTTLLSYVLSFIYVGIYWNNHHHLLQACRKVTGSVLWANLHLLFWLSLLPFATHWMDDYNNQPLPTALYGCILLAAAVAYWILQRRIVAADGRNSQLQHALGGDWKGKLSPVLYITGIGLSFVQAHLAQVMYALVALLWLIPDRRIERELGQSGE
ncbi:TMEM175 family protein [Stenotrophomonas sp.]|uniref:TMEM175 family protein n=1 Tax=Stenotrophomonas sp. TaxID=69392 RepID=UPI0028AD09A2|nr:TMEM175 family protein [Stenotrophomonas sp.]